MTSAPLPTRTQVVVIGSGFAGIGMGIKLKQSGRHDFVILDKESDLGGTWRDNTYPGCTCDVPSFMYSFSFEQNPDWTRMFSPQREIWDYLARCADKYGLADHLIYDAEVTGAQYDTQTRRWNVEVNGQELVEAQVVVTGVGALHMPKIPDLPGLETFRGPAFHSARWRHDVELSGKNVAVVGTGASAIQVVPAIAPDVGRLDLYQRTAAWITPKPDREIPPSERAFYAKHPFAERVMRDVMYWLLEARGAGFALTPRAMTWLERGANRYRERKVHDPELRAKLTPDYQIGCKRILLSRDFYPAVQRDNVDLVTTGIREVTPTGIIDDAGTLREVDAIIFGTGFDISGNLTNMKVVGRGGDVLNDVWDRSGVGAHLGMTVHGFPNLFLLLGPNTGLGHTSVVFMIESQIRYVIQALDLMDRLDAAAIEVRPDRQRTFIDRVQNRLKGTVWQSGCKSWYLDENGRNFAIWPHFTFQYWYETRRLDRTDFQLYRRAA